MFEVPESWLAFYTRDDFVGARLTHTRSGLPGYRRGYGVTLRRVLSFIVVPGSRMINATKGVRCENLGKQRIVTDIAAGLAD
jgi:hypothetical protein